MSDQITVTIDGLACILRPADRRARAWFRRHWPPGYWPYVTLPASPFSPSYLWLSEIGTRPLGGWSTFRWADKLPRRWELNTLWIPTGASRFTIGLFLIDGQSARAIYRRIQEANGNTGVTVYLERGEDRYAQVLWVLDLVPVVSHETLDKDLDEDAGDELYLLILVDDRYFWQFVHIPLDRPRRWGEVIETLQETLQAKVRFWTPEGDILYDDITTADLDRFPDLEGDILATSTTTSRVCTTSTSTSSTSSTSTSSTTSSTTSTSTTTTLPPLLPDPEGWTSPGQPATVILDALAAGLGYVVGSVFWWPGGIHCIELTRQRFFDEEGRALHVLGGRSDGTADTHYQPRNLRLSWPVCSPSGRYLKFRTLDDTLESGTGLRSYQTTGCNLSDDCARAILKRIRKIQEITAPSLSTLTLPLSDATQILAEPYADIDWVELDVTRGRMLVAAQHVAVEPAFYSLTCRDSQGGTTSTTPRPGWGNQGCEPCTCTWECVDGTARIKESTCPEGCECAPQPRRCEDEDWELTVPCVTTTTPPCSGTCRWQWNQENRAWTLVDGQCSEGCVCASPQFCGDGVLREGRQPASEPHLYDELIDKQHDHPQSRQHDTLPLSPRPPVLPRELDDEHHAQAGLLLSRYEQRLRWVSVEVRHGAQRRTDVGHRQFRLLSRVSLCLSHTSASRSVRY